MLQIDSTTCKTLKLSQTNSLVYCKLKKSGVHRHLLPFFYIFLWSYTHNIIRTLFFLKRLVVRILHAHARPTLRWWIQSSRTPSTWSCDKRDYVSRFDGGSTAEHPTGNVRAQCTDDKVLNLFCNFLDSLKVLMPDFHGNLFFCLLFTSLIQFWWCCKIVKTNQHIPTIKNNKLLIYKGYH